jgi:UDPglucose--hexose-1-phosphate uridylyltransferase
MPELRKDYITHTWVVIAVERGERPIEYKPLPKLFEEGECPFCPGRESRTPPEVLAYRMAGSLPNTQGWWIRCVPNKYPALRIEGEVNHRVSQLFNRMNGVGAHEIIIETPKHVAHTGTMELKQVEEILTAYRDRYNDLKKDRRFRYILIFKNHGERAGASLSHPHSQLIAMPMIPRRIMDEIDAARNYYRTTGGSCIYDDLIEEEIKLNERVVINTDKFLVITPFASRFPYETWILPKHHDPVFEDMNDFERAELANVLKTILYKMYTLLKDVPYNYYIHTAPCDRQDYRSYHWHIEIIPRMTHTAGFERGTGFYINPITPEYAAKFLRGDNSHE